MINLMRSVAKWRLQELSVPHQTLAGPASSRVRARLVLVLREAVRRRSDSAREHLISEHVRPVRWRERVSELAVGGNGYIQTIKTRGCPGVTRRRA